MDLQHAKMKLAFGLNRRAEFYSDMGSFMSAGIPSFKALERMVTVARGDRKTRRLADVYASIITNMRSGSSLGTAVAPWVPASEAVMLAGAETAGGDVLRQTFMELGGLLDRQRTVRKKLMSALILNGISIGVIVIVIVSIMHTLVPVLTKATTPAMTGKMNFAPYYFAFGNGVLHFGPFILAALIGLVVLLAWALPNWVGPRRLAFDRNAPVFTLYQRTQATFFLSSAASMMRAGIPLKSVLNDMERFGSKWLRWHVRRMLIALTAGKQEVEAMGSGLLPRETGNRLSVYSLIPDFTGIMTRLAEDNFRLYEESVDKFNKSMTALSTILLATFGASTLFAIFDFSNALQASVTAMQHAAGG